MANLLSTLPGLPDIHTAVKEARQTSQRVQPKKQEALQEQVQAIDKQHDLTAEYLPMLQSTYKAVATHAQQSAVRAQEGVKEVQNAFENYKTVESRNPFLRGIDVLLGRGESVTQAKKKVAMAAQQLDLTRLADSARTQELASVVDSLSKMYELETKGVQLQGERAKLKYQLYAMEEESAQNHLNNLFKFSENIGKFMDQQRKMLDDAIDGLPTAQLNAMLEEGTRQGAGAVLNADGLAIPVGRLEEEKARREQKNLEIESKQLAVKMGRMDLADRLDDNLIRNLTLAETDKAIANDGIIFGDDGEVLTQIPIDKLMAALPEKHARAKARAAILHEGGAAAMELGVRLQGMASRMNVVTERMKNHFAGSTPIPLRQAANLYTKEALEMSEEIDAAVKEGIVVTPEQLALGRDIIKQREEEFEAAVDRVAKESTDNKAVQTGLRAFLSGGYLSPEQSADTFIQTAVGGYVKGLEDNPAVKRAMGAAREVLIEELSKDENAPDFSSMTPMQMLAALTQDTATAAKLKDPLLKARITDAAVREYTAMQVDSLFKLTPEFLKQIPGDTRHPAAAIPTKLVEDALELSEMKAARALQAQGIEPDSDEWRRQYPGQVAMEFSKELISGTEGKSFGEHPNAAEAFFDGLRVVIQNGAIDQLMPRDGSATDFGSFLIDSAFGGRARDSLRVTVDNYEAAYRVLRSESAQMKTMREVVAAYGSGDNRIRAIVTAGLAGSGSESQVDGFMRELQKAAIRQKQALSIGTAAQMIQPNHADLVPNMADLEYFIKFGKLDSPEHEKTRRELAKNWDDVARRVDAVAGMKVFGGGVQ